MELRHLRYFVAVAEGEHFGRAATVLRVSQPALSHQIADLERELGVALFTRLPRGVRLTDAGRAFLATARTVLRAVDEGAAEARAIAHGLAGRLVIGLPETARGTALASAALSRFRDAHPGVVVETTGVAWLEQPRALLEGRLDVGFAWSAGDAEHGDDQRGDASTAPGTDDVAPSAASPVHRPTHLPGVVGARLYADPGTHALLPTTHPLAEPHTEPAHPTEAPITMRELATVPFGLFARELHPALHDAITAAVAAAGGPAPALVEGIGAAVAVGPLLTATAGWTLATREVALDAPPGTAARPLLGFRFASGLDVIWRAADARPLPAAFVRIALETARRAHEHGALLRP